MPTPSSGTITYYNLGHFSLGSSYNGFQDPNIGINAFTRGGYWVPNIGSPTNNQSVPASASNMGMNMYYNVWGYRRLSFTITTGNYFTGGKYPVTYGGYSAGFSANNYNYDQFGPGPTFGSISASLFVTVYGQYKIVGFYSTDYAFSYVTLNAPTSGSFPPDNEFSFIGVYSGYRNTYYPKSSQWSFNQSGNFTTQWASSAATIMPLSSGNTYSCYLNYYG